MTPSFKLLGLTSDDVWSFNSHMSDAQRKMKLRMAILRKVCNSTWGLGNGILTKTAHALIESLFNYGLTAIGPAAPTDEFGSIDKKLLNPAARRVTGVGYSARREVIYPLTNIRSARNHYLLKVANVMDRTLRASRTQAQRRMLAYMRQRMRRSELW